MENDYLWNKTGEDAEIERLEITLRPLRYQEKTPPRLPVRHSANEPRFSFLSWRLAFAFTVILTVLFSGVALWLKLQPKNEVKVIIASSAPEAKKTLPDTSSTAEPNPEKVVLPLKTRTNSKPKFINTAFRQNKEFQPETPQQKRKATPKIKLTKEEKYAFNQLMLALSITGSKLKEVQNKVNGDREPNPFIKSFR